MRILQVTNHFRPCIGGVERHVEELSKQLVARGYTSDILCLNACARGARRLPLREGFEGIKVYRLPFLDLGLYKICPIPLHRLEDYDLVHIHGLGFFSDYLGVTKLIHKKPIVLSTHGGIFHTRRFRALKSIYFNLWARLVLKSFSAIIAVSGQDEQVFSRIAKNLRFVPNGISLPSVRSKEISALDLLFVGRLSRNKGLDDLIKTFALLKRSREDLNLYIAGEDWGVKAELEDLAKGLGTEESIIFLGELGREELAEYYRKCGIFVSASRYEGFGIALLEAMAAGLVPIVNNIPAFREIVEDGDNGFIVDYSTPIKAAERISEILDKDLNVIVDSARETAARYSWENIIPKIENVYASCF